MKAIFVLEGFSRTNGTCEDLLSNRTTFWFHNQDCFILLQSTQNWSVTEAIRWSVPRCSFSNSSGWGKLVVLFALLLFCCSLNSPSFYFCWSCGDPYLWMIPSVDVHVQQAEESCVLFCAVRYCYKPASLKLIGSQLIVIEMLLFPACKADACQSFVSHMIMMWNPGKKHDN